MTAQTTSPDSAPPGMAHLQRPLWWVRPLALRSLVGALVAAAMVGVFSAITGSFGTISGQALFTVVLFVGYALLSWYDADVSAKRSSWFGIASLVVTIYLLLVGILKIWFPFSGPHNGGFEYIFSGDPSGRPDFVGEFGAWIWLAIIARVALLHVHLLLVIYRRFASEGMRVVSQGTFVLVAILAVMLSLPPLFRSVQFDEFYFRIVVALAIIDTLGTILVPLVYSLFHRPTPAPGIARPARDLVQSTQQAVAPQAAPQQAAPSSTATTFQGAPPTMAATASTPSEPAVSPQAYEPWTPDKPRLRLLWPQYLDGRPLPRNPDGSPDFTGVVGH